MAILNGTALNDILTGTALADTLNGLAGNDVLNGGAGNDVLNGGAGNDTLNGGLGADAMVGGVGNDTYTVDNVGDAVTEAALGGVDTVQSSISYTLGAEVENLVLTAASLVGTGNALNNKITGTSGNNTLDGGLGADTLVGGIGNDTYIVDNLRDVVVEVAGNGVDTIQSSVSYTLSAEVENLTLTGNAITGIGNILDNTITGNARNNSLDGGVGADTMIGGLGNDHYYVDDAADVVTELAAQGVDTVHSAVDYTLVANVENLVLAGVASVGTGNASNNVIQGNAWQMNTLDGGVGADTLIGGNLDDIFIVDNVKDVVREQVGGGIDTIQSSVSYALNDFQEVENLTLTGVAAINATGNSLDNAITGNASNNVIDGGAGVDTMTGGTGNDTYYVDNTADAVVELAAGGVDTVFSTTSYTLSANVENLTMLSNGVALNPLAVVATGNALNNTIDASKYSPYSQVTLDGGAGADTLIGRSAWSGAQDVFVVDNVGDVIQSGNIDPVLGVYIADTVQSSINYTLGADIANLTLTGTAVSGTGNASNNTIVGNAVANTLNGGAGDDRLDGGVGGDTLIGGGGNDTYVVDNALDVITANALVMGIDPIFGFPVVGGIDTIESSITWTLGLNQDNLILTGAAAINGTGNALNNWITGNAAVNTLNGGAGNDILDGGAGADVLIGGGGNDMFVVDNVLDTVTANALVLDPMGMPISGYDTVESSISWTLGANQDGLVLTGTAAINGTGNALDNNLSGNAGNNILNGGLGADTMAGMGGNDTYVVDNLLDVVFGSMLATDAAGLTTGIDTVQSSVTFTLGTDLDNLTLTGAAAINGIGNELSNTIVGNAGNNRIDGGVGFDPMMWSPMGDQSDTLTGGLGGDTFVFRAQLNGAIDTITDFAVGVDKIELSQTPWMMGGVTPFPGLSGAGTYNMFGGYTPGTGVLAANEFVSGVGAVGNAANAQILYDTATGTLSFDIDGVGVGAAIAFAKLTGIPALTAADFTVV